MTDPAVMELAGLCAKRFASLGDAVQSVLTFLGRHVPTGRVIFGELNYETDEYRILHPVKGSRVWVPESVFRCESRSAYIWRTTALRP